MSSCIRAQSTMSTKGVVKGARAVMTIEGLRVNRSELVEIFGKDGIRKLLNKFTIRYPAVAGTYFIKKLICVVTPTVIYMPRFVADKLLTTGVLSSIDVELGDGEMIDLKFSGSPTQNQHTVAQHLMSTTFSEESVSRGLGGVTICMQAGSGKTFLAMYLMGLIKRKTLVIVPNTYLLTQWVTCLRNWTNAEVGEYYGKRKTDGDIVVAIVNSLVMDTFKLGKQVVDSCTFFSRFGFVVLDESHIYSSDVFRRLYVTAQRPYMLAMSATPNEKEHGLDKISHYNVGMLMDAKSIDGYINDDIKFDCDVELVRYNGPAHLTRSILNNKTKLICVPLMLENLISDESRNLLIVHKVLELANRGCNIFVFTDRRLHADALAEILMRDNVIMYGGSDEEHIRLAKHESQIVLTTYAYSSTGVSIDRMTACVLATPRKSKSVQIIGRIFRRNDEFNDCKRFVVDIVDNQCVLKNQLSKRMIAYRERHAFIHESVEDYTKWGN